MPPRRRPRNIDVTRLELGDFERQQLSDLKWTMAAPAVGILGAGAAIGAGIYFGAMFFNNTLDEVREYLDTWWITNVGADDDTKAAVMDAIGESTIEGDTYSYNVPDWMEGLTVYAAYDLCKDWEGMIFQAQYDRWLTAQGIEHSFARRQYWNANNRSTYSRRVSNAIDERDATNVSPFAYQLMIRETAARRREGKVASLIGGGAIGGWLGAGISSAVWLAGDFVAGNNWTGDWAESAPGYIADPLLWTAWLRTDFPGVDAVPSISNPGDVNRALDYETELLETHLMMDSDPEDLRGMWPVTPMVPYAVLEVEPVDEDDPDFMGPQQYPPETPDTYAPPDEGESEDPHPGDRGDPYEEEEDPDAEREDYGPPRS